MSLKNIFLVFSLSTQFIFAAVPHWFLTPPSDDSSSLYGVGEGESLKSARDDALNTLASKLSVSISSTLSKNETQSTFGSSVSYNKDVSQHLQSEVKKISFTNYEIVSNGIENGRTYVLVKVDKEKFLEEKKQEVAEMEKEMGLNVAKAKTLPILERFSLLKESVATADKAKTLVTIITSLTTDYKKDIHLAQYAAYKLALEDSINDISVYVAGNDDDKVFKDVIREELTVQKIKVAKNFKASKNSVIVEIETNPTVKNIYGRYMAKVYVTINLKNNESDVVNSTKIECNGNSSLDAKSAITAAGKNFAKQVKEKGVLSLLGLGQS